MRTFDSLILAGAPAGPQISPEDPALSRAMLVVEGRTMLQRVVDALRDCPLVSRIAAVGSVHAEGLDLAVEPEKSLIGNIRRGIEALNPEGPVLIATSDVPLLTGAAVSDFLEKASSLDAALVYPIISRQACDTAYPGLKRTYLKTAEGSFTGGNLMLVRPDFILNNWNLIAQAYDARKHILRLARIIGLRVLSRVVIGQMIPRTLRLAYLEQAVSRVVGARVAAVITEYAEIGEDVDKLSDLEAVRGILAARNG